MSQTLPQKLLEVQKKIGAVTKSSTNPHFRSKYADLNEVLDVAKEALNEVGIFVAQGPGFSDGVRYVETSLIDAESGQQISGRVAFSGTEDNMQKIGAAITYARRFGLVSLLALEQEDDDGEAAVGRGGSKTGGTVNRSGGEGVSAGISPPQGSTKPPIQKEVPKSFNRKTANEKIRLTAKVLKNKKTITQEEADNLLKAYAVDSVEALNDDQAKKLLSQLEAKLNA